MEVFVIAIGRCKHSAPEYAIVQNYMKRLPWNVTFIEHEVKDPLPADKLKEKEGDKLLSSVSPDYAVIALEEGGKTYGSIEFSKFIQRIQEHGKSKLAFIIGGAYGLSSAVRARADYRVSLGNMTWPHLLVRPMLIEQLYRAHTIIHGHPYHKA